MRADGPQRDTWPVWTSPSLRHRLGALGIAIILGIPLPAAACEMQDQTNQSSRALCTIDGNEQITTVRFEARFGGFHDDSVVEMTIRLDGADVQCSAQDRTALSGESGDEGDVMLFCHVRVAAGDGRGRLLEGLLRFRHAELSGVQLVPVLAER